MKSCADIEPLLTCYLDGMAATEDRTDVEAHLDSCTTCREHVHAQRIARTVVRARAASLCELASPALRTRCQNVGHGKPGSLLGGRSSRALTTWLPVAIAATVILASGGWMLTSLTGRLETALAAQLALEHVKCFILSEPPAPHDTPQQVEAMLSKTYGWDIRVPASLPAEGLELLGARRCLYSEGQMAHVMYKRQGRPLSLFVLFNSRHAEKAFDLIGHEAIVWSHDGKTFALVERGPAPELERVAAYVKQVSP